MFALVDCNNFYVSCERVFNPLLIGKPVVVLSNNDGCIISRSNEAKAIGVKMGKPIFEIKDFVKEHNVKVLSSNYALYGDMSQRVMNTLASFVPAIEIYSIDEAFLSLHGFANENLAEYGETIRKVTTKNTGIPVSVGISQTKTLAKLANHFAKKKSEYKGVCVIDTDDKRIALLKEFTIGEVWGIGRQYEKMLVENGVETAFDFIGKKQSWVQKNMSIVGVRTQQELMGIVCNELETESEAKQQICVARSFGNMQTEYDVISEAVSNFASRCAMKLRKQKSCAKMILVYIHTNEHRKDLAQYAKCRVMELPVATSSTFELCSYAKAALKSIFVQGYHYKKAGVILNHIIPENAVQTSLFDTVDRDKQTGALKSLDALNSRYGKDTVRLGSQGYSKKWKLRQENLSPSYTTKWDDIITVKG